MDHTPESPTEHNARKDAERQRRLERLASKSTSAAPLAQGHGFGPDLICKHEGCNEKHPATGPCVGESVMAIRRAETGRV